LKFLPVTVENALEQVIVHLRKKTGDYFCLSNIHVLMESHMDAVLKNVLNGAAAVFADGMGTAGALKILGHRFGDRTKVY
jgi:N-acetylglucosaminyldiphosphoundecaprenol N-acetyl-beta-D-mannosaminyltransferase